MNKKQTTTTLRVTPRILLRVKQHGAAWAMPSGDAIEGILDAVAESLKCDAAWARSFRNVYETSMLGAGLDLAFWGDGSPEEEELKEKIAKRRMAYESFKGLLPGAAENLKG